MPPELFVNRNSVIVGVGTLVLGVFTLILVLLCYRHFRNHPHLRNKMCGDRRRSGSENPYVIEIRTDRQGRGGYREVPGDQDKAGRAPPPPPQQHLLQQKPRSGTPPGEPANDSDPSSGVRHKGAGLVRHNRAPPGGASEKCQQPLIGDNREEICLSVQSVLQAGCPADEADLAGDLDTMEDTPVHSSTALLQHSRDQASDND